VGGDAAADDAVIVAALRLFPDAAVVHLVRDADEVAAALARRSRSEPPAVQRVGRLPGLAARRAGLPVGRAARGAGRVTRLSFTDLVERPDEVVQRCLELAGLGFDEACARPLRTLELTGPAASEETGGHISLARDLSTALLGAPRSATPLPSLQATPAPAAALPQPPAPRPPPPVPRPPGLPAPSAAPTRSTGRWRSSGPPSRPGPWSPW
jgi:hypothetical protein